MENSNKCINYNNNSNNNTQIISNKPIRKNHNSSIRNNTIKEIQNNIEKEKKLKIKPQKMKIEKLNDIFIFNKPEFKEKKKFKISNLQIDFNLKSISNDENRINFLFKTNKNLKDLI